MTEGSQIPLQNLKLSSKTSLDDLLMAAKNSEATPLKSPNPSGPALIDPAVARCCQFYTNALKTAQTHGKSHYTALTEAEQAYRAAMPTLSGAENIRNFIACVAHGMLIDAIKSADATRLLYAAQVAHSTLDKPSPGKAGRPASNQLPEN